MNQELPLLIFPNAKRTIPAQKRRVPPRASTPSPQRQAARLKPRFKEIKEHFQAETVRLQNNTLGLEPEAVLVLETRGSLIDIRTAFQELGLDLLEESEDQVDPDEDFYLSKNQKLKEQLFLSMSNQSSLNKLLKHWNLYIKGETAPRGLAKLYDLFGQLYKISFWNTENRLKDQGFYDWIKEELEFVDGDTELVFNIELWFREEQTKRDIAQNATIAYLNKIQAQLVSTICHEGSRFHAIKAKASADVLQSLIKDHFTQDSGNGYQDLLEYNGIMFFARPTTLQLSPAEEYESESNQFGPYYGEPKIALFDGLPLVTHEAIKDGIELDDPDDLSHDYPVQKRSHGTAMASLILHGDLNDPDRQSLKRRLYVRPFLAPDQRTSIETIPQQWFVEDLLERAVKRMLEGEDGDAPTAPGVKIINLSLGDPGRFFVRTMSSWARMVDYLSHRYNVLFVISAGNQTSEFTLIREDDLKDSGPKEIRKHTMQSLNSKHLSHTIFSPAEAINALCVGALHHDHCGHNYVQGNRMDILPADKDALFPSPISPLSRGFRGAIKPEILVPGGRQLYRSRPPGSSNFHLVKSSREPGQKTAVTGDAGELQNYAFSCGTSNAAALTTHAGGHLLEVIDQLQSSQDGQSIMDDHIPALLKAMLVHGSKFPQASSDEFIKAIMDMDSPPNSRHKKRWEASYLAYGSPHFERVKNCTAQRATVIGCDRIMPSARFHEFHLPIPAEFDHFNKLRRLTITLAWMSPINPKHRQYYRAKLSFALTKKKNIYDKEDTKLIKSEEYSPAVKSIFDRFQIEKSTIQHQVFEGDRIIDVGPNETIPIQITLNQSFGGGLDATHEGIPYAIIASLEVGAAESINVYQSVKVALEAARAEADVTIKVR